MQRHFFSLRIALAVIVAGIAYASLDLWWRGYVVVGDPRGRIAGVSLENGTGMERRALRRLAAGHWATRPAFEGHLRLFCRNGVQAVRGYVSPGLRTAYVVHPDDCRPRDAAVRQRT